MSSAPRYPIPPQTVADYGHWQGDWELVEGIPIAMSPLPFGPHERLVDDIADALKHQMQIGQCSCRIYRNLDWIISDQDVVRPDLMIVCGEQPERHLQRPPELCVEVLSDSTRRHDQMVKRPLYRDQRVPFYMIAEPGCDRLQLFINDNGKEVETVELSGTDSRRIRLPSGCELELQPASLLGLDHRSDQE